MCIHPRYFGLCAAGAVLHLTFVSEVEGLKPGPNRNMEIFMTTCLCFGNCLHVAGKVISLHLILALLLLQLLFYTLGVVDMLSQLCNTVRLLLVLLLHGAGWTLQGHDAASGI